MQWGVELGKVLAKRVKGALAAADDDAAALEGFNASTKSAISFYKQHAKSKC